ncbi:MAG: ABC transporter permease subunit [Eubacteriales bacterium]
MKGLGLLDNIWAMVLYNSVTVYNLILLMRFFSDTPQAILEAAAIDGAGHIATLFKVFLPMNKIPIMTVGMFYAVARWNEFSAAASTSPPTKTQCSRCSCAALWWRATPLSCLARQYRPHRRQHELFESRNHRRGHSADPLHVPLHPEALYQRGHAGRSERITPTKTKEERK